MNRVFVLQAQEVAKWKSLYDEQRGLMEAVSRQLKSKEDLLQKKLQYIDKLEGDLLSYEERADDDAAMKNELSSLQFLVANMSSEHEGERNDLLNKLHDSEARRANLSSQLEYNSKAL